MNETHDDATPGGEPIEGAATRRAVYLPRSDALVVADCHLGKAEASNVDVPIDDGGDVRRRLSALLDQFDPGRVIVAGDLLDSFGWLPRGVRAEVTALTELAETRDAQFVVTPGNHDGALEAAFGGAATDAIDLGDGTVVCHGHERPPEDPTPIATVAEGSTSDAGSTGVERYVVGHDHPALSVDGRKRPCYLFGPGVYRGRDVLVLPAFTNMARGVTINGAHSEDLQSPLITDLDRFRPGVSDPETAETLWFPPLGDCRRFI